MSDPNPDIQPVKKEDTTPKPQNSIESLNSILTFQVQDLIDRRIDKAEGQLHEYNQNDLKRLSNKYVIWAIIATIFAVLEPLAGYFVVPQWIREYIQERMTKPELIKVAKNTVNRQMSEFVEEKINPLKADADELSKKIEMINSEIVAKQRDIESAQKLLKEQLDIQQLVVAAKAGERGKYKELKNIAAKQSEYKEIVVAALKDIEFYYETIKYQQAIPRLRDCISMMNPGYSVEEVVDSYRNSDVKLDMREAAIDTLIDYCKEGKIKENVIQELCESVDIEQNLRVIARTTLLLNYLTGKLFRSLEIDAVREWWKQNRNETRYQSPYKNYFKSLEYFYTSGITKDNIKQVTGFLDETIRLEPNAIHARCLRGYIMIILGKYDEAEKEFKIVEGRNKDFRWLLLYKSLLFACQNKINEAADLLNQALAKSPSLDITAKALAEKYSEYKNVIEKENVKWPSDKQ